MTSAFLLIVYLIKEDLLREKKKAKKAEVVHGIDKAWDKNLPELQSPAERQAVP